MKILLMLAVTNVLAISLLAQPDPYKERPVASSSSSPNRFSAVRGTRISLSNPFKPGEAVRICPATDGSGAGAGRSSGRATDASVDTKTHGTPETLSSNCNNNSFFQIAGLDEQRGLREHDHSYPGRRSAHRGRAIPNSTVAHPSWNDNGYLLSRIRAAISCGSLCLRIRTMTSSITSIPVS